MKRILILTLLSTILPLGGMWDSVLAQTPGGVSNPLLWNRSGSNNDSLTLKSNGLTFIGVGRLADNDIEQTLWSIGSETSTSYIQTTARTANLKKAAFMNYANDTLPEMRMYSYSNASQTSRGQKMYIGRAMDKKLPTADLNTPLTEFVVYDRALSASERNRAESYLALKYGITLKHSYLNSEGTIIWNYVTQKAYSNHIGGIIVDTASDLTRLEGCSTESDGFIHVACPQLASGQSLVWGDNNKVLRLVRNNSRGKWMQRTWTIQSTNMNGNKVNLSADSRDLQQFCPLADGESYYLAVDPTGTAEFPLRSVKYYKAEMTPDDSIRIADVKVDAHAAWTFRAEKDMFTTINVEGSGTEGGVLDILITGGTAPYANLLKKDSTMVYNKVANDTLVTVSSLAEGRYQLTTTDKTGIQDVKEFDITPTGIKEIAYNNAVASDGIIVNITAAPNPTSDGYVNVEIELAETAPLTLTLFTSGGATVSSKTFPKDNYLYTKVYLPNVGVYLLKAECDQTAKTIKLIRK